MRKKILYAFLIVFGLILLIPVFYFRRDIPLSKLKEKYTNQNSKFITIDDMQVHYRDEGKGKTIVLLHGTGASLHTWDEWTKSLKKHFRVIRLDLPAFGLTGPHSNHNYQISAYTAFLHQFLQKIKVSEMYIAGNSLGGLIAWQYALAHPPKVKKMILLDAAGYPSNRKAPWIFQLAKTPVLNLIVRYITPRFFIESNLKQVYFNDSKISEDLIERYYDMALREGNRQAFIERAKIPPVKNFQDLSTLQIPTLIQWGKEDTWVPVENGKEFEKILPKAKLIVYKKAGHVPMEEIPDETVKDALDFLSNEP